MQLKAYPRLSTNSRRAVSRKLWHFGRAYQYVPRGRLLVRLAKELGMSRDAVYSQLMAEREYLLKQQK
jgi:hypothetical protein